MTTPIPRRPRPVWAPPTLASRVTSLPAETTQCIVVFLHQSTGGATAGCVSVAHDVLVGMLTWLDPARSPRIAMAPLDRLASL